MYYTCCLGRADPPRSLELCPLCRGGCHSAVYPAQPCVCCDGDGFIPTAVYADPPPAAGPGDTP